MKTPRSAFIFDNDDGWIHQLSPILTSLGVENQTHIRSEEELKEMYPQAHPDMVCMTVENPVESHLQLIKHVVQKIDIHAKIVVFSTISQKATVLDCIYGGASHYILKGIDSNEIKVRLDAYIRKTNWRSNPKAASHFVRSQHLSFGV